jgi:hypothetical protein
MHRFTRLTNAFSKISETAVALHFAHYNLVRIHKRLRVTPAMAANVTNRLWSMEELIETRSLRSKAVADRGSGVSYRLTNLDASFLY